MQCDVCSGRGVVRGSRSLLVQGFHLYANRADTILILWILLLAGVGWVLLRALRGQDVLPSSSEPAESPLEILQRRYAEGEIPVEEYEKRKERLERDRQARLDQEA